MNLGIIGTGGLAREAILITNELIMKKNLIIRMFFLLNLMNIIILTLKI